MRSTFLLMLMLVLCVNSFSQTNINDVSVIEKITTEKKTHQWVDIFDSKTQWLQRTTISFTSGDWIYTLSYKPLSDLDRHTLGVKLKSREAYLYKTSTNHSKPLWSLAVAHPVFDHHVNRSGYIEFSDHALELDKWNGYTLHRLEFGDKTVIVVFVTISHKYYKKNVDSFKEMIIFKEVDEHEDGSIEFECQHVPLRYLHNFHILSMKGNEFTNSQGKKFRVELNNNKLKIMSDYTVILEEHGRF